MPGPPPSRSVSLAGVIWLFVALSALTTFVIAAVAVGGATGRQASRVRRAVYDVDAAVTFVADDLPGDVTADISYDDVRAVLDLHIDHLRERGVATYKTDDQTVGELVVVSDDESLAHVLGKLGALAEGSPDSPGAALSDEQVAQILDSEERYRRSIGGFGSEVSA